MALIDDKIKYYQDLLITQYRGKPNAMGELDLFIRTLDANNIAFNVLNAFDFDKASGSQLDVLSKYVGNIPRSIIVNGVTETLTDNEIREGLKWLGWGNTSNNYFYNINSFFKSLYGNKFSMVDMHNMSLIYIFSTDVYPSIRRLVLANLMPSPMGVATNLFLVADKTIQNFGFIDYFRETNNSGLNEYGNIDKRIFIGYDSIKRV